jgi:hypothetical protein
VEELADVQAAILFVCDKLWSTAKDGTQRVVLDRIHPDFVSRMTEKYNQYFEWDKE